MKLIISGRGLKKHFQLDRKGFFSRRHATLKAVDGIDIAVQEASTRGLVGESGCGKSTVGKLLLLLDSPTAGEIEFDGRKIQSADKVAMRAFRRAVQPVFQNPFSSLDPRMQVARIIAEPITVDRSMSRSTVKDRVGEVLETVGLRASDAEKYPHEFSGGQRQRIAIARALAPEARLIILDEAVSSQDISIRAQILNLLKDLQQKLGVSYLFIAHDLATVRYMSDRVSVMYLGKVVESADADDLCMRPQHPYTQALFAACLPDSPDAPVTTHPLGGELPSAVNIPSGCRFHPRCPHAMPICRESEPALAEIGPNHRAACFLYHDVSDD